jgi:hypothetical protein
MPLGIAIGVALVNQVVNGAVKAFYSKTNRVDFRFHNTDYFVSEFGGAGS